MLDRRTLLTGVMAAACAPADPSRLLAQPAEKLTSVTLVGSTVNPPSVSNIYYLAALEGHFQKHGLDVHLQQSGGSPSSLAAAISGRAEFASINLITLANAAAEGVKAKAVVTGNFDFPGVIISQPSIKSIKDLEGKTMAASAVGSIEYTVPRAYLTKHGVNVDKINWVATGQTANSAQALAANQVAAAWIVVSSAIQLLTHSPQLKILVPAEILSKESPSSGGIVCVTDKLAQSKPDLIQTFVDAVIESNRRMYTERAFFDSVLAKRFPGIYTPAQADELYAAYRPSWGVNGGLELSVLDDVLESWKTRINPARAKNPYFSKVEDLVDTRFARAALEKVGIMPGALDTADWMKTK
jgi:ABC-type nitrate/sulfonate/bicarbonate transport system substrate-binding protein